VTVAWLDGDPLTVAPALDARVDTRLAGPAGGGGTSGVVFAGPFETVVPWQWDWFDAE
jgi:hypothetical protein